MSRLVVTHMLLVRSLRLATLVLALVMAAVVFGATAAALTGGGSPVLHHAAYGADALFRLLWL